MLRHALVAALSLLVACSEASPEALSDRDTNEPASGGSGSESADKPGGKGEASGDEAGKPPRGDELGGKVGEWTWLDVPESVCGNGEATGFGVNLGTSSELVIYMDGGRACWDALTCGAGLAKNFKDGYVAASFDEEIAEGRIAEYGDGGLFDRTLESNPFKDASFVFLPYCTGDVYAGDRTDGDLHFAGRKNYQAFLEKIAPAFKHASRVTLTGSSAGGFGAAINYWRTHEAFGKKRVDLIDDSGPPFESDEMPLLETWRKAWDIDGALPPGCEACKDSLAELPGYYAKTYPGSRQALTSYAQDAVISIFYATPPPVFAERLTKLTDTRLAPLENSRSFIVSGASHTMLGDLSTESGDVTLAEWLGQMHSDSNEWTNQRP